MDDVLYTGNTSRLSYLKSHLIVAACIVLTVIIFPKRNANPGIGLFMAIFMITAVVLIFLSEIRVRQKKLVIGRHNATLLMGIFFRKRSIALQYAGITEVTMKQNLFERILNYGDISIHTSGGKLHDITMESVGNPAKIKALLDQMVVHYHARRR
ncbi:MAG: PH domain-containing protein [archaeon]